MDIIDRILRLMSERNITATLLTTKTGLSRSAISEWKKGKAQPSVDAIAKIAIFFNVSTDFLLGIEKLTAPDVEQPVSEEVQKLAERIMNLSPNKVAKVLDYLDLLEK